MTRPRSKTLHEDAVAGLYRAALYPDEMHEAISAVAARVGADTFHFMAWDRQRMTTRFNVYSHAQLADGIEDYAAYYGAIDPRRQLLDSQPIGSVLACHQHFSSDAVSRDEFFQDFLIPMGSRYVAGSRVWTDGNQDFVLGLMRDVGNQPFSADTLMEAERLVAHFGRASQLWADTRALQAAAAVGERVAQVQGLAHFGLNSQGELVYANGNAEAHLREGTVLRLSHTRLVACDPRDEEALSSGVRHVLDQRSGCSRLIGHWAPGGAVMVSIAPLDIDRNASAWSLDQASVLVTVRRRDFGAAPAPIALQQMYGLSRAEASLAVSLCRGDTLQEYAEAAGLSVATVRTQLKAIFQKTATSRQAELVSLLLQVPG
ncbi:MAG: helix-turn-helix transcriptional regulator [Proteobacteria bacterium]|nr:helix-turn-helix transcriptional regulator [Pseudomonadota bacterium]